MDNKTHLGLGFISLGDKTNVVAITDVTITGPSSIPVFLYCYERKMPNKKSNVKNSFKEWR